ncbi:MULTISPECIES: hypothetical protein [Xenorhabdus]|uniref:hypothetical protein n=1 Tax=Xenorhabdus TaxID=626 RepID=UPI00064A79C1|nr:MULTISPECIES: hypothetical protein [Xenorhabdus]KLU14527.1 hypothetical protein AAY47_15830 [Xenorhabdus griffiniae]KOP33318.1 hypothetical protein AFK69_10110 [Xenorhabdus sp. GDc328]
MLRKSIAVLFLVSFVSGCSSLPEPQDKVAFNNFREVLRNYNAKDDTATYVKPKYNTNPEVKMTMDGISYAMYMPNEDVLSKECNEPAPCEEFVSAVRAMFKLHAKEVTASERKRMLQILLDYGVKVGIPNERAERIRQFIEQHKSELKRKFGID